MKNTILHWTSVLLACSTLSFAACASDDDNPEEKVSPVFPDLAELTIPAGETSCEVSFTPNLDWTVSIPTDAETSRWFELRDGEMPVSSISGTASSTPVSVTVATIDLASFDLAPVCEVSLTMGGQTEVIAKITRANTARTFELFASEYNVTEEDDFTIPYVYSETALTKYTGSATEIPDEEAADQAVELKWPIRVGSYMYVFKSSSNFSWLASTPDWISISSTPIEEETGAYQITVNGLFTEENQDGAVGVIDFYDANIDKEEDPGNNAHNRYCIKIPAFRDLVRHPIASNNVTFQFDIDGNYLSNSMGSDESKLDRLTADVYSTKGLKIFALMNDGYGGYYANREYTNWISIEDSWDDAGATLQRHSYSVRVTANNSGAKRTADLLALPQTLAAQIDENGDLDSQLLEYPSYDLKAEYKPYVYASLEQAGPNTGENGLVFSDDYGYNSMYKQLGYYTFEDITEADPYTDEDAASYYDEIANGSKLYRLTYSNMSMSQGSFFLTISGEYTMVSSMPLGNEWLMFADMEDGTAMISMEGYGSAGSKGDKGSLVFYGSNNMVVARIICIRNY